MVPGLEDMGIQMLLNENHAIERDNQRIYLAGIDDAHYYRVDNIEKAATGIPFEIFRSCYRTRPRSISRRLMPISACSSRAHPRWANLSPGRIPITSDRSYHATWVRAHKSGDVIELSFSVLAGEGGGEGGWCCSDFSGAVELPPGMLHACVRARKRG